VLGYSFWAEQIKLAPKYCTNQVSRYSNSLIGIMCRLFQQGDVEALFMPLPDRAYHMRDRISRYPSLALVKSYQKWKKSNDNDDAGPVIHRRKSSLIEAMVGGGEIARTGSKMSRDGGGGGGGVVRLNSNNLNRSSNPLY
jgi:hypothetical protein